MSDVTEDDAGRPHLMIDRSADWQPACRRAWQPELCFLLK